MYHLLVLIEDFIELQTVILMGKRSYTMNNGCIQLFSSTSDRRLKNIGSKNLAGLNEINKLKIYNFTFKNDDKNARKSVS